MEEAGSWQPTDVDADELQHLIRINCLDDGSRCN
jgi:hypothetical protein